MASLSIKAFAEEGETVAYVAETLGIPHNEAESLYCDLGGYGGNGPVNFSTVWPDDDAFSQCIQALMTEKGISSLMVGYED